MVEIPKVMTLWSTDGHHAGFMLVSSEAGSSQGDCVFMLTPVSSEGIDSEMGIIVSELKVDGEQHFYLERLNEGYEFIVKPKSFPYLVFKLNSDFEGEVFSEFDNETKCVGSAEPTKKNA